ncbi:MAG: class I SAM-dependent methyltransferase [bacterium]
MDKRLSLILLSLIILMIVGLLPLSAQGTTRETPLDKRVQAFLAGKDGEWHDMNVPESDGRLLYDLIVKHKYKRVLEIGTSTGHSSIWIAWALSKTGGKLITIEIDEERYKTAIANFKEAGLSEYIDARLTDAHELVHQLKGPFDFVFSDADKDWYKNYFLAIAPKLTIGGCYTTHNISERGFGSRGNRGYVDFLKSLPNFETTFDSNGGGVSISYKKSEK